MTHMSLRKANLERIGLESYRCLKCGSIWSPNLRRGGRLPKGWWRCPNGCNREIMMPGQKTPVKPVMNMKSKRTVTIEEGYYYRVLKNTDGEREYICKKCGKTMDRTVIKEYPFNTIVQIRCPTSGSDGRSYLVSEHFEPNEDEMKIYGVD